LETKPLCCNASTRAGSTRDGNFCSPELTAKITGYTVCHPSGLQLWIWDIRPSLVEPALVEALQQSGLVSKDFWEHGKCTSIIRGKQLINFITCRCESSAPFYVIYKAGCKTHAVLVIGLYELLDPNLIKFGAQNLLDPNLKNPPWKFNGTCLTWLQLNYVRKSDMSSQWTSAVDLE
jgi:hypothetical protein